MNTSLGNIATIQTGIFAKPVSYGEIVYLQAKHFNETGKLNSVLHPDLKQDNITEKHLLKPGDVLFAAKGTKNFAAEYESKNQPAVASTSFFVIRLQENFNRKILPEYLVWFFNHPSTQKILKSKAIGTSLQSISKAVLQDLEMPMPPVKTQKAILKIDLLRKQELSLQKQMENHKERYIQQLLLNAIKS